MTITFQINGRVVTGNEGETVLTVARRNGFEIPTLCHHPALEPNGACRLCIVEVTREEWHGGKDFVVSCIYPIADGIQVTTHSPEVINIRKSIIELLMARCPDSKKIKTMGAEYGLKESAYQSSDKPELRDNCILCGSCARICAEMGFAAISTTGRGHNKVIAPPLLQAPVDCVGCLSCVRICPTHNIRYKDEQGKRLIWGREFELLHCERCGKVMLTVDFAEALKKRQDLPDNTFTLCDECKKADTIATVEKLLNWNQGS
ncbi:(2Fe-2S)-binding protein [bacterium]|nr:(2Fe-2S)-binding protein [bacterium]